MSNALNSVLRGSIILHRQFPGAALLGLSIFIILGAWSFQLIGGLAPCALCLEQRVPWYLLIGLGGLLVGTRQLGFSRQIETGLFALAVALAIWAAYLALYHAGVEYKWWLGPSTCTTAGGGLDQTGSLENLAPVPMCDVVPWKLGVVSLAGFNFLFSLVATFLAGWGLLSTLKDKS